MLVLRNPLDIAPTETRGIKMASLMGAPEAPPVVKIVKGRPGWYTPKPRGPRRNRNSTAWRPSGPPSAPKR